MQQYQVLARKYRPKNFHELVGQTHVSKALINAIDNNRLHHAYLFTGTRGVGKTTIARILSKCLNCETGITSTPCGVCTNCVAIDQGHFIDLIEIDAASRTKVEDTRDLLDNVPYSPTQGRYKVYLIDEVHMLSTHSFNALLKTLEEPPNHVKFLLATTDPQKLPITIISRCLQFVLRPLAQQAITEHLAHLLSLENVDYTESALWQLAHAAKGSVRDALSLTDQAISFGQGMLTDETINDMLGLIDSADLISLIQHIYQGDSATVALHIEQMRMQLVDAQSMFDGLAELLHQLAIVQLLPEVTLNVSPEQDDKIRALSRLISADVLQLYYQIVIQGREQIKLANTPLQALEMCLLRLLAFRPLAGNEIVVCEDSQLLPSADFNTETMTENSNEVSNNVTKSDDNYQDPHIDQDLHIDQDTCIEQNTHNESIKHMTQRQDNVTLIDNQKKTNQLNKIESKPAIAPASSDDTDLLKHSLDSRNSTDSINLLNSNPSLPKDSHQHDANIEVTEKDTSKATTITGNQTNSEHDIFQIPQEQTLDEQIPSQESINDGDSVDHDFANQAFTNYQENSLVSNTRIEIQSKDKSNGTDSSINIAEDDISKQLEMVASNGLNKTVKVEHKSLDDQDDIDEKLKSNNNDGLSITNIQTDEMSLAHQKLDLATVDPRELLECSKEVLTGQWTPAKWDYWLQTAIQSNKLHQDELALARQGMMLGEINGESEFIVAFDAKHMSTTFASLSKQLNSEFSNSNITIKVNKSIIAKNSESLPKHREAHRVQQAKMTAKHQLMNAPVMKLLTKDNEGKITKIKLNL